MNIVYLILARAGSKRVKNKNLRKIKNKSLVEYSIEFAKKVSKIDKIILSTDSEKIRKLGIKKGLFIPELRPKKLSKSNTSSYQSARYEIAMYEKYSLILHPTICSSTFDPSSNEINRFEPIPVFFSPKNFVDF